jgi:hypothetical protein
MREPGNLSLHCNINHTRLTVRDFYLGYLRFERLDTTAIGRWRVT